MLPPSKRAWYPLNYLKVSQNPALSLLRVSALALTWELGRSLSWQDTETFLNARFLKQRSIFEGPLVSDVSNHCQFNTAVSSVDLKKVFKIYLYPSFLFPPVTSATAKDKEERFYVAGFYDDHVQGFACSKRIRQEKITARVTEAHSTKLIVTSDNSNAR